MSITPIIQSNEKIINVNYENKKIELKFIIKDNNLFISTEFNDSLISHFYSATLSIQDIQKNKYFLQFDSIEEILNELLLKLNSSSPVFKKENNYLNITIMLSSSKFKEVNFILYEKTKSNEDKIKELYNIIFELKKENEIIKQENSQFKKDIKMLIEFKNKIEEKEKEKKERLGIDIDSSILNNDKEKIKKIKEFISPNKTIKSKLKYRMTRDGASFENFHSKCDGISPNLLLISDNNNIFGAFTKVCWEKKDCQKNDTESFLFSLNKNKKYYQKHKDYKTIFCYQNFGPWFYGGDIGFSSKDMSLCCCNKSEYVNDELLAGNKVNEYFKVQEVEVFEITIE